MGIETSTSSALWAPSSTNCIRPSDRSSFAGPRFWHGGVMLQRAKFWLCWKASLYDRLAGRTARNSGKCGPECAIDLRFRPYLRSFPGEGWDRQDQLPSITRLPLHHYTGYSMHLITMWSCLTAAPLKTLRDHLNRLGRASDRRPGSPEGRSSWSLTTTGRARHLPHLTEVIVRWTTSSRCPARGRMVTWLTWTAPSFPARTQGMGPSHLGVATILLIASITERWWPH